MGKLHRAQEKVHQANYTCSGPVTALVLGMLCLGDSVDHFTV